MAVSVYDHTLNLLRKRLPVWLYEFDFGGTVTRYTNFFDPLRSGYTLNSNSYTYKKGLSHSRIQHTTQVNANPVRVTLPLTDNLVSSFLGIKGVVDCTLTIRHGFFEDAVSNFAVKYVGEYAGCKPDGGAYCVLEFDTMAGMQQSIDNNVIQQPCPWLLYGPECGLSQAAWTVTEQVDDATSNTLNVPGLEAYGTDDFTGGVLAYAGETRTILKSSGTSLVVEYPIVQMTEDIATYGYVDASLSYGCDLSRTRCNTFFSNILNYGGYYDINENPFRENLF